MVTASIVAIGWKLALVSMAAWRRRLEERNWPYNATQREVSQHVAVVEARRQRVAG